MKLPERPKEEINNSMQPFECGENTRKYPWGLEICLETEQIDKIPSLMDYKVGEKVTITAEATVTEVRMTESINYDDEHKVKIQIEKLSCEPLFDKKPEEMNIKEYRRMRETKY